MDEKPKSIEREILAKSFDYIQDMLAKPYSIESFDDYCSGFVAFELSKQRDRCIKEREECWLMLAGFIDAHLAWFEELKKKAKEMESKDHV